MVKNKKLKPKLNLYLVVLISFIFLSFSPFLWNADLLTKKDNDLGRNYIPIFVFIKQSILVNKSLPLWRPDQMIGENFVGNPLSSLFYPVNVLAVLLPTNVFAVVYYILHLLLSAVATFYLAKSFRLSNNSAIIAAIFYTFSIKTLLHISAGHITMVASFSFFPLIFLSLRQLLTHANLKWIIVGAFSVYGMLSTYPTIFYYTFIFCLFYIMYNLRFLKNLNKQERNKSYIYVTALFGFGLLASLVFLIPQLEFASYSTRSSLTIGDVAQPVWNFHRLLLSLIFPYFNINDLDHESFLYLGLVPYSLAFFGFLKLSRFQKIVVLMFSFTTLIFVAGQSTPVFKFFFEWAPLLKYSRITTRVWFTLVLVAALLAASAVDRIKNKKIIFILTVIFLTESFFICYKKIYNTPFLDFSNKALYEYIAKDKEIFRVYCTTYCFNPQQLSKYKIQLLAGETPIQQQNAVNFLKRAGNYNFEKFAVIFPPYQVWQVENPPQPNIQLLGIANVKYIASTYVLDDADLNYIDKFNNIYLYKNNLFKPRYYFFNSQDLINIDLYSPNTIKLSFPSQNESRVLNISETFFPGWYTKVGGQKLTIKKDQNNFQTVTIPPFTSQLVLQFLPNTLLLGSSISVGFFLLLFILFWYKRIHN